MAELLPIEVIQDVVTRFDQQPLEKDGSLSDLIIDVPDKFTLFMFSDFPYALSASSDLTSCTFVNKETPSHTTGIQITTVYRGQEKEYIIPVKREEQTTEEQKRGRIAPMATIYTIDNDPSARIAHLTPPAEASTVIFNAQKAMRLAA